MYFSFFYIRLFIKDRGVEYISYVSVYISRGIESSSHGPCWSIRENDAPSEQQITAETFFSKLGKRALDLKPSATPRLKQTWESDIEQVDALAELSATTEKIAMRMSNSINAVLGLFTVMEVLEVLIDCLTFAELSADDDWFDSGVIAGKGIINAGFTTYYLVVEYSDPAKEWKRFDWEAGEGLY